MDLKNKLRKPLPSVVSDVDADIYNGVDQSNDAASLMSLINSLKGEYTDRDNQEGLDKIDGVEVEAVKAVPGLAEREKILMAPPLLSPEENTYRNRMLKKLQMIGIK